MSELKTALVLVNDKRTPLKEVEGQLKVEYQYAGEAEFTKVVDEQIRGDFKTISGQFPEAPAGKEIKEERVEFTPDLTKYPFYESRTAVYKTQFRKRTDLEFAIGEKKLTLEDKKKIKEEQKAATKSILLSKWNRIKPEAAE